MFIRYLALEFGCLALGELAVALTAIPLPSSIIGMLLLTLFLRLRWVKLHHIKGLSDLLISNLGLFFIPPSIAIMDYLDTIKANFWGIMGVIVISTILVIASTGHVYQLFRKRMEFNMKPFNKKHHQK